LIEADQQQQGRPDHCAGSGWSFLAARWSSLNNEP
jgi:hypothetical protein